MKQMSTEKSTHPLPTPTELKDEAPLSTELAEGIASSRRQLRAILSGNEQEKKVIIAGPCSIHDVEATMEYASKLAALADEVSDVLLLTMRTYYEKPRTLLGWKGLCLDPHLDGSYDIAQGVATTRRLLLEITGLGLPLAAEFLNPFTAPYFEDLISWGCIGSRTAESQTHRELASGLPMPVAFKNNTDGNVETAIKGIIASSAPHSYMSLDEWGRVSSCRSPGNSDSHLVLRGGDGAPNYSSESVAAALQSLEQALLPLRLLIDCSHDNSYGNHEYQPAVFEAVLDQILAGNSAIKGMILESHLFAGKQKLKSGSLYYGISVTDSCLDWETTEALILQAARALRNSRLSSSEEQSSSPYIDSPLDAAYVTP